jgi:ubiquinone/menaquinone biosynthesis C-methylase UbiE
MKPFTDLFSKQAASYQKHRPTSPPALFEYLHSLTTEHQLAWDCGTGNGQAAIGLADFYEQVYATDPSEQQIKHATLHPRIIYKIERAETCGLTDHTADLITIANALHWFDFSTFYAEVKRVLKPNGVIAAWTYGHTTISPGIDAIIKHYHDEIVGEFWQDENRLIDKNYATIPFPFEPVSAPPFSTHKEMSFDDLIGLIHSWSATQKYIDKYASDPVKNIQQQLRSLWQNEKATASWQLILKIGRNKK